MSTCEACGRTFEAYCAACESLADEGYANDYEAITRAKKVAAIVAELDDVMSSIELDPHTDAALIVRLLKSAGVDWRGVAQSARVNAPSETTISAVIDIYVRRAGNVTVGAVSQ